MRSPSDDFGTEDTGRATGLTGPARPVPHSVGDGCAGERCWKSSELGGQGETWPPGAAAAAAQVVDGGSPTPGP